MTTCVIPFTAAFFDFPIGLLFSSNTKIPSKISLQIKLRYDGAENLDILAHWHCVIQLLINLSIKITLLFFLIELHWKYGMSLINEKPATASCTKSGADVSTAQPQTYPGDLSIWVSYLTGWHHPQDNFLPWYILAINCFKDFLAWFGCCLPLPC